MRIPLAPAVVLALAFAVIGSTRIHAQDAPDAAAAPIERVPPPSADRAIAPEPPPDVPPPPPYDPAIFDRTLPPADLAFMKQFDGAPSNELYRDKQFHRILKEIIPDCMYHYGRDMTLSQAVDFALSGSADPVRVVDHRYVFLSGRASTPLRNDGRAFLWFDTEQGIGVGGFFFRPNNGEPTPTVTVFSRLIHAPDVLLHSQLPPEFGNALGSFELQYRIPLLTTRYFISASNRRVLLEHDEDFCSPTSNAFEVDDCLQMDSDAADTDLDTAYYLEQVHYATNATAWMIKSQDQVDFVAFRTRSCATVVDPIGCRVRLTRERIVKVTHQPIGHPMRR